MSIAIPFYLGSFVVLENPNCLFFPLISCVYLDLDIITSVVKKSFPSNSFFCDVCSCFITVWENLGANSEFCNYKMGSAQHSGSVSGNDTGHVGK